MKAAIFCICLAWFCALAKTPGPRIHFREYRIGPVTYRGSFPFFDVWETMPDSLREILKRFPQTRLVDTVAIRKRDTSIHVSVGAPNGGGDPSYSLTLGGTVISSRIWHIGMNKGAGKDFLLVLNTQDKDPDGEVKIIHDGKAFNWNPRAHGGMPPLAMRDGLITVDTLGILLHGDDTAHFAVRKNGKELYRFQVCEPAREPILGFSAWGDKWILQTFNHLVVDGEDVNEKIGSDEVFNGRAFAGGLFYFAKAKDRRYRAYRNGIPFGKAYEFLAHDYCCGTAVMNVRDGESLIWFFGIRRGTWYLAMIDSQQPTTAN